MSPTATLARLAPRRAASPWYGAPAASSDDAQWETGEAVDAQ
jgi:hypothetical protein